MWGFVNTIQLLTHSLLLNVDLHENVIAFNAMLLESVDLSEFFPVSKWLGIDSQIETELREDASVNKLFELLEYGADDCISNIVSFFGMLLLMGVCVGVGKGVSHLLKLKNKYPRVRKSVQMNATLSTLIRLLIESYIQLGVSFLILSHWMVASTPLQSTIKVVSTICSVLWVITPIATFGFLLSTRSRLDNKKFLREYNALYDSLRRKHLLQIN